MPVAAWTGIRDASVAGAPAEQMSFGWNARAAAASSEDCLYLNVWTPSAPSSVRYPVMVWIHGGGNTGGAGGADPLYDSPSLVSHGVILVVVEYRLGIFGFFAHPELARESPHHASGNYALLDQIAALQSSGAIRAASPFLANRRAPSMSCPSWHRHSPAVCSKGPSGKAAV
jgi:para-nitrobenzyl esterase